MVILLNGSVRANWLEPIRGVSQRFGGAPAADAGLPEEEIGQDPHDGQHGNHYHPGNRLLDLACYRPGDPSFSLHQGSTFCVAFSIRYAVVCSRNPGAGNPFDPEKVLTMFPEYPPGNSAIQWRIRTLENKNHV